MRAFLCMLLAAACVGADESEDRRSKLPYIADAVGNTLPPPSNGPATVGSPVNLLTPDRYEFYTFDESGELVKRLMTLEEIQAIVAAGEETEGLVTFANENQPTIAFNFSQPPYTKVHSVVTNVQNVLKAQMEAHKNKPQVQPTLDTPDVSDSWSLILPSIFGNTGVDIVPDKSSNTFSTPETETIELDSSFDDNSISKEGTNQLINSTSTKINEELKEVDVTEKMPATSSTTEKITTTERTTTTTTTTTTARPKTTTTTHKPRTTTITTTTSTTTKAPSTITSTKSTAPLKVSPTTSKPTTVKRVVTTTSTTTQPRTTSLPTTVKPRTTTTKPTTKVVNTTANPLTSSNLTTRKTTITQLDNDDNFTRIQTFTNTAHTTVQSTVQHEKISTFIPLSTAAYVTERATTKSTKTPFVSSSTKKYVSSTTKAPATTTTKAPTTTMTKAPTTTTAKAPTTTTTEAALTTTSTKATPAITTYRPLSTTLTYLPTENKDESDRFNATTVTTQSVSPSTTVSSTEFVSISPHTSITKNKPSEQNKNDVKPNEELPLFDISQSISQIASDLGGNYRPIPTSSDLLDTTKYSDVNMESKENLEIDIPSDGEKENLANNIQSDDKKYDNFIKISTLEPQKHTENIILESIAINKTQTKTTITSIGKETTTNSPVITTTIDPVLSESMGDLLSQIVNQGPEKIISVEKEENASSTTQIPNVSAEMSTTTTMSTTTVMNVASKTTSDADNPVKIEISSQKPGLKVKESSKTESKAEDNNNNKDSEKGSQLKAKPNFNEQTTDDNQKQTTSNKVEASSEKNQSDKIETTEINIETRFQESTTKHIQKLEISTHKPALSGSKNNTESQVDEITLKEDSVKVINKSQQHQIPSKEIIRVNKTDNYTTLSTSDEKSETTKRPVTPVKKPEFSSDSNKIVPTSKDKIANIKENGKPIEETSVPKVDEFKKKIQKVNIDDKELVNDRNNSWKLISTVTPPKTNEIPKDKFKTESQETTGDKNLVLDFSKENQGLEVTTKNLNEDMAQFTELCNELAFRYWQTITDSIEKKRSFVLSPYSITSMLAMMFMGARGATSGEMNEILKLDDMVTFNPHFTLKNISDSIETSPSSGVVVSAFVRELFTDRNKGKVLTFYKERAQHFYNGHVEEINFKLISDIIRRRTNLLVKRYTWGKIVEYMKSNTLTMNPPLAAFSTNIFETDCSGSSVEGRDGEMYFVVSPNVRQRRLVPVPAVVYRSGFLAGYDPVLDATAAALGNTNSVVSTLFLMPGQQGNVVHAEDLEQLEKRLLDSNPTTPAWNRLLRTLLPRIGLELQIPRFSHKSLFNISTTLKKMGLKELFDPDHADLGGLNGPSKDLYLSDMVQSTSYVTCGEGVIGEQHHIEEYPEHLMGPQRRRTSRWAVGWDEPRDYQRAFHDPHDVGEAMHLPLHLRPRQARLPARNAQPARLKFDRPFLYFVRHNPSGMILYVGRYNPRLLP